MRECACPGKAENITCGCECHGCRRNLGCTQDAEANRRFCPDC